jgi:hypothetical protein
MKQIVFILALIASLVSCQSGMQPEIKQLMNQQVTDWNKGDIEAFMKPFWKNDSLMFVGKSGLTYGWSKVLNNYVKSYPNRSEMGVLGFDLDKIIPLGGAHCLVVGRWTLKREADQPKGYFSLVWKKIDGEWKIISDHSS